MDLQSAVHVKPNEGGVGDVFNEIMYGRAMVSDCNPDQTWRDMVRVNEAKGTGGWFVRYSGNGMPGGKDEFSENLREYIGHHGVEDMSHFVGEEFASMIKENNTTPLKKIQAMKARRVVQEIIDFQCQEVPMTKSANKR